MGDHELGPERGRQDCGKWTRSGGCGIAFQKDRAKLTKIWWRQRKLVFGAKVVPFG